MKDIYITKYQILQKNGFSSKHNIDCWNQKEYIGFGAASHSYNENVRYSKIENIENYINNIETKNFGKNIIIHEKQNKEEIQKEFMLIGLRKIGGVSIEEFKNRFSKDPLKLYKREISKLIKKDLLEISNNYIKLTNKGLDFANIVWEEFV